MNMMGIKAPLFFILVVLHWSSIESHNIAKSSWQFTREAANVVWHEIDETTVIPESFDAREAWPNCSSIAEIHDEGNCNSCWAVAAASVMSDRLCIFSKGVIQKTIAAQFLLGCSEWSGCRGGFPLEAFNLWTYQGVPTGGYYNSSYGCQRYKMKPCSHYHSDPKLPNCEEPLEDKPSCVHKCDANSEINLEKDLTYGRDGYYVAWNETQIQLEIMTNGTVTAGVRLYSDFYSYKSGIYKVGKNATNNDPNHIPLNGHAVKLLGWGVENGTKFWLAANSWGKSWGEHGTFKIIRGVNECYVENQVITAVPKL